MGVDDRRSHRQMLLHECVVAVLQSGGCYLVLRKEAGYECFRAHLRPDEKHKNALARIIGERSGLQLSMYDLVGESVQRPDPSCREANHVFSAYRCVASGTLDARVALLTNDQVKTANLDPELRYWLSRVPIVGSTPKAS